MDVSDERITVSVEPTQVLVFLRAIGAKVPFDRDEPDLPVPPTFLQTIQQYLPDYPLRPQPGRPWMGSAREPSGVVAGDRDTNILHGEQHYEFFRELRIGDRLESVTRAGDSWEKEGRSGPMRFTEQITEFRDELGELVATARLVDIEVKHVD
ncbi:hypothetical protein NOCA250019 [metagenome]|uniref:FAS1-like dehydratase domain-containing protein n=1 Tax=metagenome TaxID=256318 RepID=A0A2P2C8P9_9ZZZZ